VQSTPTLPSRLTIADWLKDALDDKGINITLEQAYYRVVVYTNKQESSRNFKITPSIPYPATINKPVQPSFWTKITGLFHREPSIQEYLLSDDQIHHSGENEYYEHIEDEE
jgi:hypothetical protein